MDPRTCAYVASKDDPESWHGTNSSQFFLDRDPEHGGLGISKWHCPHPPLGQEHGDEKYCIFHTETEVSADRQREELLDALDDAGEGSCDDQREHRGQFVGATFGPIDLSGVIITATDDYDIRFDHALFFASCFKDTRFEAQGRYPISFVNTDFTAHGADNVMFKDATFRTASGGAVVFEDATFGSIGDGDVVFENATFTSLGDGDVVFEDVMFKTFGDGDVVFEDVTFRTFGDGDMVFEDATFTSLGDGDVMFEDATLTDVDFRFVDFGEANLRGAKLTGTDFSYSDLREAHIGDVSVNGATICRQLYEDSQFTSEEWDATARSYHDLKTVFSGHGLVGKAWSMHIRERRARSREAKAAYGWFDRRYLRSLPSRVFTGYGVRVRNLVLWMIALFLISTVVYVYMGVEETLMENVSYSVLAFTVAPPKIPEGVGPQIVMMAETFFGTLSIVLLGYILGNRERF